MLRDLTRIAPSFSGDKSFKNRAIRIAAGVLGGSLCALGTVEVLACLPVRQTSLYERMAAATSFSPSFWWVFPATRISFALMVIGFGYLAAKGRFSCLHLTPFAIGAMFAGSEEPTAKNLRHFHEHFVTSVAMFPLAFIGFAIILPLLKGLAAPTLQTAD